MPERRKRKFRGLHGEAEMEVVQGELGPVVKVTFSLLGHPGSSASASFSPGNARKIGQALLDMAAIAEEEAHPDRN